MLYRPKDLKKISSVLNFPIMKKIILIALLSSLTTLVSAQFDQKTSFLQPSPNASSVIKYANSPVNLYTGNVGIVADLYTLKGRDYSIPIGFSYHSAGIKVQDVSSSVGLGWSMSVNSLISRVVRGRPDELTNGYMANDMGDQLDAPLDHTTLFGIYDNTIDAEPDLFYYNINGQCGKFVFDKDQNPVMLPETGIKIVNTPFKQELGIDGWVLTDQLGNEFLFGTDSGSKEETVSTSYWKDGSQTLPSFVSSWFLKTIKTNNHTENITYNYTAGSSISVTNFRKMQAYRIKTHIETTYPKYFLFIRIQDYETSVEYEVIDQSEWDANQVEVVASPKYLTSIVTDNQSAYFDYDPSNTRSDLINGRQLSKVQVKDYDGNLIKIFNLNQGYFYCAGPGALVDNYRLKLNSIDEISPNDPNKTIPLYRLEYNSINLPPRYSTEIDHWGYYNTNPYGFFPDDMTQIENYKNTDSVRVMGNMLKKITYQTGGYKEFLFESNEFYNDGKHVNQKIGGVRIARILTVGGENTAPLVSRYTYKNNIGNSSGRIAFPQPVYFINIEHNDTQIPYFPLNFGTQNIPNFGVPSTQYGCLILPVSQSQSFISAAVNMGLNNVLNSSGSFATDHISPFVIRGSVSFNSLFDVDGSVVGYSTVTEENIGEGKTVTSFTDVVDYPDLTNQMRVDEDFVYLHRISANVTPFTPATSFSFARGFPKEIRYYNKDGLGIKYIVNEYELGSQEFRVKGFRCAVGKVSSVFTPSTSYSNSYFNIGYYEYVSRNLLLNKSTEYNTINPNSVVSKEIEYYYKATHPYLITDMNTTNSDGVVMQTLYKYVLDKASVTYANTSETDAADQLYTDGKFAILLEKIDKRNGVIVGAEKTGFKKWIINSKNLILPEYLYAGNGSSSIPKIQFNNYDEYGNNLQLEAKGGIKSSMLWNYHQLYPEAEVLNAGLGEVFYEDFENSSPSGITTGTGYTGNKFVTGSYTINFTPPNGKNYKYGYWYRSGGVWQFSGYAQYIGPTQVISAGDAIDHVLVIPQDALLSSTTYSPKLGVIANTDNKRLATSLLYDDFNRLISIKDYKGNLVKHFQYNEVSQQMPQIYINSRKSQVFTNNYCSAAAFPINYIVPEGKHFSYISQVDADNKANTDIASNGQAYANGKGQCGIFVRVEISNVRYNYVGIETQQIADLYYKFYQDEACTIPVNTSIGFNVRFGTDSHTYNGIDANIYDSDDREDYISPNVSSSFAGTYVITKNHNYYNYTYNQSFTEITNYTYKTLTDWGSNYFPLPTH
jgi:hypothetical protein